MLYKILPHLIYKSDLAVWSFGQFLEEQTIHCLFLKKFTSNWDAAITGVTNFLEHCDSDFCHCGIFSLSTRWSQCCTLKTTVHWYIHLIKCTFLLFLVYFFFPSKSANVKETTQFIFDRYKSLLIIKLNSCLWNLHWWDRSYKTFQLVSIYYFYK